jgi:hypothetical protein
VALSVGVEAQSERSSLPGLADHDLSAGWSRHGFLLSLAVSELRAERAEWRARRQRRRGQLAAASRRTDRQQRSAAIGSAAASRVSAEWLAGRVGTTGGGDESAVDEVESKAQSRLRALTEAPCAEFAGVLVDVGHINAEMLRDHGGGYPRHRLEQ